LTKKLAVSQETLTKTFLRQKQPNIKQELPVKKKTLLTIAFISVLLISAAEAFFVKSTQANPYNRIYKKVLPPPGTKPPEIIIYTPKNGSYYPKNLNLTFDVNIPKTNGDNSIDYVTKLYYKASWESDEIIITEYNFLKSTSLIVNSTSFSIDLSDVQRGNHSLTIYAVGDGAYPSKSETHGEPMTIYYDWFKIIGYSTVSFIKDVIPPRISLLSPQNGTYVTSDVELDFAVSENASKIIYCLDGKENQTLADSLTLTGLAEGAHNVTLYVYDLAGNAASPQTLFFNVDLPESFPIMSVAASVVTVALVSLGVGLPVYYSNRKR